MDFQYFQLHICVLSPRVDLSEYRKYMHAGSTILEDTVCMCLWLGLPKDSPRVQLQTNIAKHGQGQVLMGLEWRLR